MNKKNHHLFWLFIVPVIFSVFTVSAQAMASPGPEVFTEAVFFPPDYPFSMLQIPAGLAGYVTYDEKSGICILHTPFEPEEKSLEALRETAADAAVLFVLYTLQVVDAGGSSGFDYFFSGEFSSGETGEHRQLVITPGELRGENDLHFRTAMNMDFSVHKEVGEAWIIAAPGRRVAWSAGLDYPGERDNKDERFILELTPTFVDQITGRVKSEVVLRLNDERSVRVSTTVFSGDGTPEIIAFLRRTVEQERGGVFSAGTRVERTFAVLLAAKPVSFKDLPKEPYPLPVASLKGLDFLAPPLLAAAGEKRRIETGVVFTAKNIKPTLRFTAPVDEKTGLEVSVAGPASSYAAIKRELRAGRGTFFEAALAFGVEAGTTPALIMGISDSARLLNKVQAFISWQPLIVPLYPGTSPGEKIWRAGIEVEREKIKLAVSYSGNPGFCRQEWQTGFRLPKDKWISLGVIREKKTRSHLFICLDWQI